MTTDEILLDAALGFREGLLADRSPEFWAIEHTKVADVCSGAHLAMVVAAIDGQRTIITEADIESGRQAREFLDGGAPLVDALAMVLAMRLYAQAAGWVG